MDIGIGTDLKGYEIHEKIGSGGFGVVYQAYQPSLSRHVAVKAVLPELTDQPNFIRSFEREAHLVARLEHMHIVPLYDFWREPQGAYLVMRWLKGGSLQQLIAAEGSLSLEDSIQVVGQIAQALYNAHKNNIIHRDVKPSNILLDEDGNAYLTDFGIAQDSAVQDDTLHRVGTPAYLFAQR